MTCPRDSTGNKIFLPETLCWLTKGNQHLAWENPGKPISSESVEAGMIMILVLNGQYPKNPLIAPQYASLKELWKHMLPMDEGGGAKNNKPVNWDGPAMVETISSRFRMKVQT